LTERLVALFTFVGFDLVVRALVFLHGRVLREVVAAYFTLEIRMSR
jgi:hypothetical protein